MIMKCPFCKEYHCPTHCQFYQEIGKKHNISSRVLLETENWYAIPTIGSLTVGYVLLVCKKHYLSLSNLSDKLYYEMIDLKTKIEKIIFEKMGLPCVCFEHGTPSKITSGANSVNHVHIHILPVTNASWQDVSQNQYISNYLIIDNYEQLWTELKHNTETSYLLFEDTDKKIYFIGDASGTPSQFFRKGLASVLSLEEWNWKKEYYVENMMKTIELFDEQRL